MPGAEAGASEASETQALTGEIDNSDMDTNNLPVVSDRGAAALGSYTGEDAVTRLRNMIGERQEETVEVLRIWLEGEEENA